MKRFLCVPRLIVLASLLLFMLILSSQTASSITADPPLVILEVHKAKAMESCTDVAYVAPWCRQDFKTKVFLAGDPPVTSNYLTDRDTASWSPPFTVTHPIADPSAPPRFITAKVELWDYDDVASDDQFDINQSPAIKALELTFETCTFHVSGGGLPYQSPGITEYPQGHESDPARITLAFHTGDYRPFSPNDIAIADASPVQVVYKPEYIIAEKPTAFRLKLTSSFPNPRLSKVKVTLSDGATTVTENREVMVPPDANGVTEFFFDGLGTHKPPFIPTKPLEGVGTFTYNVEITVADEIDDPTSVWANCWTANNYVHDATLPIIRTRVPVTVYARWNWIFFESHRVDLPELADFFKANTRFFKAIFPVANHEARYTPTQIVSSYTYLIEPAGSIAVMSRSAYLSGIDRLVMTVPDDWFEVMYDAGWMWVGDGSKSGMSLAEAADHAVLAESGLSEVAVHEIGHTYRLSQRACTPSDAGLWLLEYFFGMGCRDEYTHTSGEGRPYQDDGFDVLGDIYPTGYGLPANSRNLTKITNFMDTTPGSLYPPTYDRWMDKFSYDLVAQQMRLKSDPDIMVLSGYIKLPGWPEPPAGAMSGEYLPVYKTSGFPTMEMPAIGQAVGEGLFSIRVNTGQGARTYRFMPAFGDEGSVFVISGTGYGLFNFTVPWEEGIISIELWGPSEWSPYAKLESRLLATITRSASQPVISRLLAGKNTPPDMQGQGVPPHIRYEDKAYIRWAVSDQDTPGSHLRAAFLLLPPASQDPMEYTGFIPMAVDIEGDHLLIDYSQLRERPGKYGGKLVVTDGVNTATIESAELFYIDQPILYLPVVSK